MDVTEARALLGEATFLDVREPYEFDAGHVEGSLHIPIGQVGERWREVPSDGRVVVVCQIGQRSALVADFLRQRGLDAHNLEGGLESWVGQGGTLEPVDDPAEVAEGFARDLSGRRLDGR